MIHIFQLSLQELQLNNMKTKKLLIHALNRYFYPVTAGIEVNMLKTYERIVANHEVVIETTVNTLDKENVLKGEENVNGLDVHRYPLQWWGFWPEIDWDRISVLAIHNFHIFPHSLLLLYSGVRNLLGKKHYAVVVTPHGGFNPEWSVFPFVSRWVKRIYHYSVGVMLLNWAADGIRAVSEWEKQEMIKFGVSPKLIRVISNGVEDDAFEDIEALASNEIKRTVKSWGRYIIQIGRVYPIKNYETTIRALVHLPKDINYIIVGPVEKNAYPDYFKQLEALIDELGVNDRVKFVGVIHGIDKYYVIKHSLMMVHMALWESFCNVVHEGMSQGKICIVADNTALKFLVTEGKTGYRIETNNSDALAEKINYVIENLSSKDVISVQKQSLAFGRQTSWKSVAKKMEDFYVELFSKLHIN